MVQKPVFCKYISPADPHDIAAFYLCPPGTLKDHCFESPKSLGACELLAWWQEDNLACHGSPFTASRAR